MMDTIVILACLELFIFWLMEIADCLNFATVSAVVFMFAMMTMWFYAKEMKR